MSKRPSRGNAVWAIQEYKRGCVAFQVIPAEGNRTTNMRNTVQIYHAYPQRRYSINEKPEKAILFLSDIFGVPLLQNKLYFPPPRTPTTRKVSNIYT